MIVHIIVLLKNDFFVVLLFTQKLRGSYRNQEGREMRKIVKKT